MIRQRTSRLSGHIRSIFASNTFFYVSLGLFILSSVWVATASLYPMAFDEDFHMGLIKIYSQNWLPYGIEQTRDMAVYGPAAADASYLFHYLLSFPYRLLAFFAVPIDIIVILLRILNIGMVVAGLFIFRTLLREAGISRAITHVSLALYMLIPIMPVLAGQVNYDNLLLPIIAFAFLCTIRISRALTTSHQLPVLSTWALIITILFGMPTKYAFLPLVASIAGWLLFVVYRVRKRSSPNKLLKSFMRDSQRIPRRHKIIITGLIALGLFFSFHYVTNYFQYGDPIPSCDEVFDEKACLAYGPWQRNYYLKQNLDPTFDPVSLPEYVNNDWLPGMALRLTFAVAGPTNSYQTKQPLPILRTTLTTLTIVGLVCLLATFVFTKRYHLLIGVTLLASVIYLVPLVWKLYLSYAMTGEAVAVNGRYLLPLLPLVTSLLIVGMHEVLRRAGVARFAPLLGGALLGFIIFIGGGVTTYIVLAEAHWFWQGWGQTSHALLQTVLNWFILR